MRRPRRSPLSKKAKAEAKGNPKQSNGRGMRRKAKPAQREPEYFQEKRNLEDLWPDAFPIGTKVSIFVKACKDQIDILKNRIYDKEKIRNSNRWLPILDDSSRADVIAHKHGMVLILSERLHSVTAQFDRLRSIRFQDAVNRAMPRRKMHKVSVAKSLEASKPDVADFGEQEPASSSGPVRVQDQLLDDETRALQAELTSLLDAVQETETKMVEMSALNHLMSTHVLQQAQQIEHLYEQAVEATKNVEHGNKELMQAIKRNSSSKTFLLLFLFVVTFSVLFLDWYNS